MNLYMNYKFIKTHFNKFKYLKYLLYPVFKGSSKCNLQHTIIYIYNSIINNADLIYINIQTEIIMIMLLVDH